MAAVSLFQKDAAAALDAARRAVELAPEDFESNLLLGQAHAASARAAGSDAKDPDRAALGESLAAIDHAVALADEKEAWASAPRTGAAPRELARACGRGAGGLP